MKLTVTEYFHLLRWEYFYLCSDKSVLEIGPLHGEHSKIILSAGCSNLDLIDIDPEVCKDLMKLTSYSNLRSIACSDVTEFLIKEYPVDVTVCLGLIYHLHSPIKLLELIVNSTRSKHVILDGIDVNQFSLYEDPLGYTYTKFNQLERKTNLSLMMPFKEIDNVMSLLGYKLIKYEFLEVPDFWKNNIWMAIWERQ